MLERIVGLWRRRKWLALLVFAVPATVVAGVATSLPSVYRSTATVLVERQQVPEAFVRSTVTGEVETRLQTISQEIFSRATLETIIDRYQLYSKLRRRLSPEKVVAHMRNDILLIKKSDSANPAGPKMVAFTIAWRGANPAQVADVTNTLAQLFIEENLRVRTRQASGTADFLRAQLEETTKALDVQEQRVSEYSRRHMGELPQQMTSNLAAIEQLSTQLRLSSDRQSLALARREALERQLADVETVPAPAPVAVAPNTPDTPAQRLARLRQELRELRAQYTEKYPEVVRVRDEVAALQREMGEAADAPTPIIPTVLPPDPVARRLRGALTEVDAEVKALKKDEQRLLGAIAQYQARLDNTPKREQEFLELSRNYQTTKDHYQSLLKRYQEAQLAEDMEQRRKGEQFRVLDAATPSGEPAAPNRLRLLLVGLAISLGLAAGAVALVEHLDTSFHSADELRASSELPVLLSIPPIVTGADGRALRLRTCLATAGMLLALLAVFGASRAVAQHDGSVLAMLTRGTS